MMKKSDDTPREKINLLDLAPVIDTIAKATGTRLVSLAINYQHAALAVQPAKGKAVGPKRLRQMLADTGIYPGLFMTLKPKKGYAVTSGSFGAYAAEMIPTKRGPYWLKTEKLKTTDRRPWPLLTVLFEFV
ncbi:MAG TPA: hypothetical protein VJ965_04630, partial [Anaerolineales bacterium]|nr:hypothetical protein [Anaerolineales bacterium]